MCSISYCPQVFQLSLNNEFFTEKERYIWSEDRGENGGGGGLIELFSDKTKKCFNAGWEGSYNDKCRWLAPTGKYIFLAGKRPSTDGCWLATEENILLLAGSEERIFFSQDS